jgi:phosphate transport system substrate-binding protein
MILLRTALLAAALGTPLPAVAEEVRLSAPDGALEVSGTLIGFDGEFYRVETVYGPMTLDAEEVECTGSACPDPDAFAPEVRLSGPPELGALLLPALIEGYAARLDLAAERIIADDRHFSYVLTNRQTGRPAIRFHFRLAGSDEAFADLLAGEADIALSAREVRPGEVVLASEAGLGQLDAPRRSRVLALDGLVAITAVGNPVDRVTLRDLARVLAGEITNWSELGGPDLVISAHLGAEGAAVAQGVDARVLRRFGKEAGSGITRHDSNAELADAVAADPAAIGVTAFSETGSARVISFAGPCGYRATPTAEALKSEDYPLTTPLFAYLPAKRLPKPVRAFLDYAQSPQAALVVRRAGFVDQRPETIPIDRQGLRISNAVRQAGDGVGLGELRAMIDTLFDAGRLTVTFRFEEGSSDLDAQSRSNISLLADAIRRGDFDGRTLLFVGFSDGVGSADQNRRLSERRAEAVRQAVIGSGEPDSVAIEVAGFGEALPMACDDVDWGQQINRRVEVWVR